MSDELMSRETAIDLLSRLADGWRGKPAGNCPNLVAALDAAIAALGGGWLPIETAPKDGTRIAIRFASGNEHEASWRTTYGGEWHVDSFTHLPWADQNKIVEWKQIPPATQEARHDER